MGAAVGLIAAGGELPAELARAARAEGRRVVAVALRELADPALERDVDELHWLYLGEFRPLLGALRGADVHEVAMAGKLPKTFLWQQRDAVRPDDLALAVMARAADRADDSLLGVVADALEHEGLRILGQKQVAPGLVAGEGVLGASKPTPEAWEDVRFGFPIARALGGLDVGQTVVVQGKAVLALEAIEGTDEAVRRGCSLGEPGAVVVKVAKPQQDPRFDVPAVGPQTIRVLAEGRASALAVEAGATLVVDRAATLAAADAAGIAVVGVGERSLRAPAAEVT